VEGYLDGVLDTKQFLFRQPAERFSFEATYNYNRAITASPDLAFSQFLLGLLVSF